MRRIVSITAGRGPVECRRAVRTVSDALIAEAEETGISIDPIPGYDPDGEGPYSMGLILSGDAVDVFLPRWIGTVKCVARSERRSKSDRKNWFVGVREERRPDPASVVDEKDVAFSAMAAGGPGGQHVNKTASAIRAIHLPSGAMVVVRDERSQHRNRKVALERLAALLDERARQDAVVAERNNWIDRIQVERGRPIRVIRAR